MPKCTLLLTITSLLALHARHYVFFLVHGIFSFVCLSTKMVHEVLCRGLCCKYFRLSLYMR
jgi:hypothetical protein